MMRSRLEPGVAVAIAALVAACTSKPTGPACEEAKYQGRVANSLGTDYGPVTLEIDDRARSSGRIDGVKDGEDHFLGEVTWTDVEVDCAPGRFGTGSGLAPDCRSEDVNLRADFTDEGSWGGWLDVYCWNAGTHAKGMSLILTFEAFPVD